MCSIKRYLERVSRCEWMGIHYTPEKAWRDRLSVNNFDRFLSIVKMRDKINKKKNYEFTNVA